MAYAPPVRRRWPEIFIALLLFAFVAWRPQKAVLLGAFLVVALYFAPTLWKRALGRR